MTDKGYSRSCLNSSYLEPDSAIWRTEAMKTLIKQRQTMEQRLLRPPDRSNSIQTYGQAALLDEHQPRYVPFVIQDVFSSCSDDRFMRRI